jgi:hypothetical protein
MLLCFHGLFECILRSVSRDMNGMLWFDPWVGSLQKYLACRSRALLEQASLLSGMKRPATVDIIDIRRAKNSSMYWVYVGCWTDSVYSYCVVLCKSSPDSVSTDKNMAKTGLVLLWPCPGFSRVSVRSGDLLNYLPNQHCPILLICWSSYRSRSAREPLCSVRLSTRSSNRSLCSPSGFRHSCQSHPFTFFYCCWHSLSPYLGRRE